MALNENSDEAVKRVFFSLLTPCVKVATQHGITLKDVTEILRLAYFKELRRQGKTLAEASDTMDVSLRTTKRMSQKLRENFFASELDHELPRRIEFMLWAHPMGLPRLKQLLSDVEEQEITDALDKLIEDGRAKLVAGRTPQYHSTSAVTRLVTDGWTARIGGLNSLMNNVYETVVGRLFRQDTNAFARTISFRVDEAQVAELRTFYEQQLIKRIEELESESDVDADKIDLQLSLIWGRYSSEEETK